MQHTAQKVLIINIFNSLFKINLCLRPQYSGFLRVPNINTWHLKLVLISCMDDSVASSGGMADRNTWKRWRDAAEDSYGNDISWWEEERGQGILYGFKLAKFRWVGPSEFSQQLTKASATSSDGSCGHMLVKGSVFYSFPDLYFSS